MTILSYASPYNVQLELMNGNNKLRASGSSSKASVSPGPGRQSPLVHPLCRSSSQSDRNTVSIFNNKYPIRPNVFNYKHLHSFRSKEILENNCS